MYDGVDYTGVNRALVTVSNTSEHGESHVYNWNDSSANDTEIGLDSVNHDFTGVGAGNYQLDFTVSGTPDINSTPLFLMVLIILTIFNIKIHLKRMI